jgi:uncharacterized protein YbaP (TraB family)
MKHIKTKLLSLLILITISVKAQNTSENALLWEISGNGLTHSSYIFGTIHLIPENDFFFTDIMKENLLKCNTLALEIDMDMSLSEKIELSKKMLLPEGKEISEFMTEEQYKKFISFLTDTLKIGKLKLNMMTKYKPIFSSALIISELIGKSKTYEEEFMTLAKKNKIHVIGLETADYQINVLDKISIEDQVKMLFENDLNQNGLDDYYKLVESYKNQNLNDLYELFKNEETIVDFEEDLLVKRNKNWISVIENQIKNQSVFIAVGAGHLPGNKGVLNLLTKQGYIIKPININK